MTKSAAKHFFADNNEFELDNKAYWKGEIGFLLFDRCLLMLKGRDTDKPSLLLIQRLKDISFLAYTQEHGVIVGSKQMSKEARG